MADEEVGLPKTTIAKLAKDAAAPVLQGTTVRGLSGDAVDAVLTCSDEFVRLVYAEALEAADTAKKSTVLPDHVVAAVSNLGFDEEILELVRDAAARVKADAQASREASKEAARAGGGVGGGAAMTEEEAIAMQQRLFAEARERAAAAAAAAAAPAPPAGEGD